MPNATSLTKADIANFIDRLNATIADAERFHELKASLGKVFGTPTRGRRAADKTVTAAPTGATKRGGRRRRRRGVNLELEGKIIDAVKGTKGGLGSVELATKLGVDTDKVKPLAQRLKARKIFKVVGNRRNAKYQFIG